jgi:mRNA-degrading endonuclease toxin of MazEF toxin-antitoxin module
MIVVAMTSNPIQTTWSFVIAARDVIDGQLNRPGTVRIDKIYTLAQSLAVVRFGRVSSGVLDRICDGLVKLVQASN